jgi:transposase
MGRKRRKFTSEFKAEAVRLCKVGDRSIGQVAKDLDLTDGALREWVKRADIDTGKGPPGALTTAEREELTRLRRENKRLQMEREILKKTVVGVARPVGREARAGLRERRLGRSGRPLFGGTSPLKNMVQGAQRT